MKTAGEELRTLIATLISRGYGVDEIEGAMKEYLSPDSEKHHKVESWHTFTQWFPEVNPRLLANVDLKKIEITSKDGAVFSFEISEDKIAPECAECVHAPSKYCNKPCSLDADDGSAACYRMDHYQDVAGDEPNKEDKYKRWGRLFAEFLKTAECQKLVEEIDKMYTTAPAEPTPPMFNLNHYVTIYPNDKGWNKIHNILQETYHLSFSEATKRIVLRKNDGGYRDQLWVIISDLNELFFDGQSYLEKTEIVLGGE